MDLAYWNGEIDLSFDNHNWNFWRWLIPIFRCIFLLFLFMEVGKNSWLLPPFAASEEFLDLIKSALLAALEGQIAVLIVCYFLPAYWWLIFQYLYSTSCWSTLRTCCVQRQIRVVWCARPRSSCEECFHPVWCRWLYTNRASRCHALVFLLSPSMSSSSYWLAVALFQVVAISN